LHSASQQVGESSESPSQLHYLLLHYLLALHLQPRTALTVFKPLKKDPAMQQLQLALTPSAGGFMKKQLSALLGLALLALASAYARIIWMLLSI
jgi:hypothetical protein